MLTKELGNVTKKRDAKQDVKKSLKEDAQAEAE